MKMSEIKEEKSCYQIAIDCFIAGFQKDSKPFYLDDFSITFIIGNNTTNAPLIYAILDKIEEKICIIEKNNVIIRINDEEDFINNAEYLCDLLKIIKSWKSLSIKLKDTLINYTQFDYLMYYCFEKNNQKPNWGYYPELSVKYLPKKRKKTVNTLTNEKILICKSKPEEALNTVINAYIDIYGNNIEVKKYCISKYEVVLDIEQDFVISFRVVPKSWRRGDEEKDWEFPEIMVQELTYNGIFKFNYQGFRRRFSFDSIGIEFFKFHGLHYYIKAIDQFDYVDYCLPQLSLKKRIESYSGETYHFVILKILDCNNNIVYGVGNTKNSIHTFVQKLCDELESKNSRTLELNGASCLPYAENKNFIKAFLSWKGEKKRWRLENKFSYYYTDLSVKNDLDLFHIPKDIIIKAQNGEYNNCDFGTYTKPVNKWKSEELVYNITKKLYQDYQVIYQYRPCYLATDKGNMSYDIYICGLKIAIEYQGKQHFEPVEFFGGKDNYEKQHERDKLKAQLSNKNGVKLVYINYWEDITPDLIKRKIEEIL